MNYEHPGYKKPYPIATVLRDLASQEGCDGEPYDVMIAAAGEIARLTAALEAMENRAEVAEYKQRQAVQEVQPIIIARAEKAEAEIARLTAALDATITARDMMGNLWAKAQTDLATSRAETAMAFEVAKEAIARDVMDWDDESFGESNSADETADYIRNLDLAPADATAALAARDKATREKALRDAAAIARQNRERWLCAAGFEGFATGAKIIFDAILSLIQEENQ